MKVWRIILVVTLFVGLGAAALVLADRHRAERSQIAVEIAGDYHGLADLAAAAGRDFSSVAEELKRAGLTSFVVGETNLDRLIALGAVHRFTLGELVLERRLSGTAGGPAGSILARYGGRPEAAGYQVFFFDDAERWRLAASALRAECGEAVKPFGDGSFPALVIESGRDLGSQGLGYDPRELAEVRRSGLAPVLLVKCPEGFAGRRLAGLTAAARSWGIRGILLMQSRTGDRTAEARAVKRAADAFAAAGLAPSFREFNGLAEDKWAAPLAAEAHYRLTKYFLSQPRYVRGKDVSTADVVDQWARTVTERNVRVVYVRPLLRPERAVAANLNETAAAVGDLTKRLRNLGLHPGRAAVLAAREPSGPLRAAIAAGIAAGCLLFLGAVTGKSRLWLVPGLLIPAAAAAFVEFTRFVPAGPRGLFHQAAALAAACIFPCLAAALITGRRSPSTAPLRTLAGEAVVLTLAATGLAVIGGALAAALLSEPAYLLKFTAFRGVKLALVLPLGAALLFYAARIGFWAGAEGRPLTMGDQGERLLAQPLRLGDLLLVAVLAGAFFLLWERSGNSGLGLVSGLEMRFRAALERVLVARPRTKELLAFPLFMLYPWLRARCRRFPAALSLLAGMVGLAGIVNSFIHLRCPIGLTVLRTVYSVGFGLAGGLLLIAVVSAIEKTWNRVAGEPGRSMLRPYTGTGKP
ncbi:MAG: DUF5693 family protein [Bacteroidota bacterium]